MRIDLLYVAILLVFPAALRSQIVGQSVVLQTDLLVDDRSKIAAKIPSKSMSDAASVLEATYTYIVVSVDAEEELVYLQPLKFSSSEYSKKYNDFIFPVKVGDFLVSAREADLLPIVEVGSLSLPFKFWGSTDRDDVEFQSTLNLNGVLRVPFRTGIFGDLTFNGVLGSGLSEVSISSANVTGEFSGEPQTIASINILTGVMLDYKKAQFGVYVGVDYINNASNYDWQNHRDVWFSIGIGYDIFSATIATKKSN